MAGRSNLEPIITEVLWADAELVLVSVGYEAVTINIEESTGKPRTIECRGYIGYAQVGAWDEIVIERAELRVEHESIDRCVRAIASRYGNEWPSTGSEARNRKEWKALIVYLSDGSTLEIVAVEFHVAP